MIFVEIFNMFIKGAHEINFYAKFLTALTENSLTILPPSLSSTQLEFSSEQIDLLVKTQPFFAQTLHPFPVPS